MNVCQCHNKVVVFLRKKKVRNVCAVVLFVTTVLIFLMIFFEGVFGFEFPFDDQVAAVILVTIPSSLFVVLLSFFLEVCCDIFTHPFLKYVLPLLLSIVVTPVVCVFGILMLIIFAVWNGITP